MSNVVLTWDDNLNPAGTTYNVYRSVSSSASFTLITQVTAKTYTDMNVTAGTYSYHVTAVVGAVESAPSNTVTASVVVPPPTNLVAVVQ